jgi:hypothetical protein
MGATGVLPAVFVFATLLQTAGGTPALRNPATETLLATIKIPANSAF